MSNNCCDRQEQNTETKAGVSLVDLVYFDHVGKGRIGIYYKFLDCNMSF